MAFWDLLSGLLPVFVLLFTTTRCQNYRDGDVRLVGGSYQWEGRVEVYMSGEWGTITDSDWTDDDAVVVCRKLGHFRPGATGHSGAYFGEGRGPVNPDSVQCTGSEYSLTDCEIEDSGRRTTHSLDVGVKCQPAEGSYREGDIRLVGGPHNWEGRVEIFWEGTWGTISDPQWTFSDARVVCKQLQHASGSGEAVSCCRSYGKGTDAIHIRDVGCSGTEENVTACRYYNVTGPRSHDYDVGVRCQQGNEAREGEIRLNRSSAGDLWQGRVEIFLSGEWGTVCDDGAYSNDAQVVCRQLGYTVYSSFYGGFGQGTGPIHFAYPACTGSEYRLNDCVNQTASCEHYEDWGVYCRIDGPQPLEVRLSSNSYDGYAQVFLSGVWVPIADSWGTWGMDNSEVVCRQLGYNGTVATYLNYYSIVRTVETMDNVWCSGSEYQLSDCIYDVHVTAIDNVPRTLCAYYGCSTGEVRLVGGESEGEGRLEVCNNRRWGSVCGTQWTNRHTAVVCRYFGFSDLPTDLTYYSAEKYGKGSGPVLMDFVNCTGNEWRLWGRCTYWTHYYGCSHDDDIGVQCAPARCSDGQLRLAEGSDTYYGRVEICSDQRWSTLSLSQWSYTNARIACIELGFQYSFTYISYGNSGGPRHSKYFRCTGSELRLSQCPSYNDTYTRSYSSDIGVYCRLDNCVNGQIRLMEGEDQLEGRLEVCYSGRWGNVGGDEWTENNTRVVCNSLGYDFSDGSTNLSIPTAPSKPLYYHSVKCSSRDLSLEECGFTKYTDLTKTYPHTVVKCQESQCKDGDLRLVGGATESEGRLEVCFGRRWGTVDGHGWTHTDTQVACRQLGHPTEDVSYTKHQRTRSVSSTFLPTFMTLVGCYGSEDKLTDCSYHESSSSTSMDISISCDRKDNSTTEPSSPTATNDDGTGGSSESSSGMVYASLSVSGLLAVVVIALVAVLIVVFVLWRRKKSRGSSSGIHFSNKNETVSLDNKLVGEDIPTESFEQMKATNPIPLPPRSQLRQAPSDNASTMPPQKADSSRYAQGGGNSRANTGPKTLPHVLPKRGRPRPPSEEDIYECPD